MKRNLLILICCMLCIQLSGQTLQTTRKTLFYKYTADWCPPCGGWGWALFDSMMNRQKNDANFKAICISYHQTSDQEFLNTLIASDISANTPLGFLAGLPGFIVNNTDVTDLVDPLATSTPANVAQQLINTETSSPSIAGIGFNATIKNGDSVVVQTKVKFQNAATGEYRVAVYALEDSIAGTQTDDLNSLFNTHHRMILKDAVQYGTFGTVITTTSVSANQEFINHFRMKIPPGWQTTRLRFVAILYKKDGNGKYVVENATNSGSLVATSINDLPQLSEMSIYPSPAKDKLTISFISYPDRPLVVTLYDVHARKVADVYQVLAKGSTNNKITYQLPASLSPGTYFLHCQSGEEKHVKTVLVQ